MATPIGHRVELNAVRELHFVCLIKLTELFLSFCLLLQISCLPLLTVLYSSVVGELVLLETCKLVGLVVPRRKGAPSSWQLY